MTSSRVRSGLVALLLGPVAAAAAIAGETPGVGILGDSYSDEYQSYPPIRSAARNWVEILAETRGLDFGAWRDSSRGEPRNQGYEYNWARSDATTDDLIRAGQHTGLALQVKAGLVRYVVIFIGGNDFIEALESQTPAVALEARFPHSLANLRRVVESILAASPTVRMVLVTVPDPRDLPDVARLVRDGRASGAAGDRFTAALWRYNFEIRAYGFRDPRVAVADFEALVRIANLASREDSRLLGRKVTRRRAGDDLDHVFLSDERHLGTLGQGVLAQLIVQALDVKHAAGIPPLTDREVLDYARSVAPAPKAKPALTPTGDTLAGRDSLLLPRAAQAPAPAP